MEQQVNLREEHIRVERRPVDREISPGEVSRLRDQTIEVTEMAEEPVVAKRARVREEVIVGKDYTERTETVRENVRRTEVEVEQLGAETSPGASTADLSSDYRRDFEQNYGPGADFAAMRPAYEYGSRLGSDSRYRGKSWAEVEGDIRSGYERDNPGAWEKAKNAVRYGWEKVTGRR